MTRWSPVISPRTAIPHISGEWHISIGVTREHESDVGYQRKLREGLIGGAYEFRPFPFFFLCVIV